ncbi:MAG: hypothetical protein HC932_00400 [Thermales bacterium]|nr:hypothetical protein [Thermales bacterium]
MFDVDQAVTTVCFDTFADYDGDGVQDNNEPQINGISTNLVQNPGSITVQTISSTGAGQTCFTPADITPSITYQVVQTTPTGGVLTNGNTATQDANALPNDGATINNTTRIYSYQGDSTITPTAFRDDNQNATNDSEPAVTGILATLKDASGNTITSNLAINGVNNFPNLLSSSVNGGNYTIEINKNSLNVVSTTVEPRVITLNNGASVSEAFGFYSATTVCPYPTFQDFNGNGVQNTGDSNLTGLTTNLVRVSDSQTVQTLSTNGTTCFTNVIPNNYRVEQTTPNGGILTSSSNISGNVSTGSQPGGAGTTALFPVATQFGINETVRFGYQGSAQICPYPTYEDRNINGTQNLPEDININGLTTTLRNGNGIEVSSLSTNGTTCFTGLLDGSYRVVQTPPANTTSTTGGIDKVVNVTGQGNVNTQFGYNGAPQICPVAYRDDNSNGVNNSEPQLSGATLTLRDEVGTFIESIISSGGEDCFSTSLVVGDEYQVEAEVLSNYTITSTTNPVTITNLGFAQKYTPEFGYNGNATVCVTHTFIDANTNGAFNTGETLLAGINTRIRQAGSSTDIQVIPTPNESGGANQFCFSPIAPGQYTVLQDTPAGSSSTTGGSQTFNVSASSTTDLVFGYTGNGTVCNNIFNDEDFDTIFDNSETRLSGYTVELFLQSDLLTPVRTLTSSTSGATCFSGLFPEDYRVVVSNITPGFSSSTGGDFIDNTINGVSSFINNNFGYTNNPEFVLGAIRGFVYVDRDEDGNYEAFGQDTAEITVFDNDVPVTDQEIRLYKDSGGANFTLFSTILTDNEGRYAFTGLTPGTYRVVLPNALGTKAVLPTVPSSPILSGAQETTDIFITNDEKISGTDFSVQYTARICIDHFVDKNNDGVFDADGDDNNILTTSDNDIDLTLAPSPGVYYQLEYQSFNGTQVASNGNAQGYLILGANGCIEELPPRDYTVKFRSDLVDNNIGNGGLSYTSIFDSRLYDQVTTNQTLTIFLGTQENLTARTFTNFVLNTTTSNLSGRLWNRRPGYEQNNLISYSQIDLDGNDNLTGTDTTNDYDYDNDFVYSGQTVELQKCSPAFGEDSSDVNIWNASPPTSLTNSSGEFSFSNIPPGGYAVIRQVALPFTNSIRVRVNICDTGTFVPLAGFEYQSTDFNSNYIFWNNYPVGIYGTAGDAPGTNYTDYGIEARFQPQAQAYLFIDQNLNGVYDYWEENRPLGNIDGQLQGTFAQKTSSDDLIDEISSSNQVSYLFQAIIPDTYDYE